MTPKYPLLYVQQDTPTKGLYFNAYAIDKRPIYIGQVKLTDILDELDALRLAEVQRLEEEKNYER